MVAHFAYGIPRLSMMYKQAALIDCFGYCISRSLNRQAGDLRVTRIPAEVSTPREDIAMTCVLQADGCLLYMVSITNESVTTTLQTEKYWRDTSRHD